MLKEEDLKLTVTTNNRPVKLVTGHDIPAEVWEGFTHCDKDAPTFFQINNLWYSLNDFGRIRTKSAQAQWRDPHALVCEDDSPLRAWHGYVLDEVKPTKVIRLTYDCEGVIVGYIRIVRKE